MSQQKAFILQNLEQEKSALEDKVQMMRPATLSADMLEEQARAILGYKHKDEFVVLDN